MTQTATLQLKNIEKNLEKFVATIINRLMHLQAINFFEGFLDRWMPKEKKLTFYSTILQLTIEQLLDRSSKEWTSCIHAVIYQLLLNELSTDARLLGCIAPHKPAAGGRADRLLLLTDYRSGWPILIDSGSPASYRPCHLNNVNPADDALVTANPLGGSLTPHFGLTARPERVDLDQPYPWMFNMANVNCIVLGADFLSFYQLEIDMHRRAIRRTESDGDDDESSAAKKFELKFDQLGKQKMLQNNENSVEGR